MASHFVEAFIKIAKTWQLKLNLASSFSQNGEFAASFNNTA